MFKLVYSSRNNFFVFVNYHTSRGGGQDQSIVNTRHFSRLSPYYYLICMIIDKMILRILTSVTYPVLVTLLGIREDARVLGTEEVRGH